MDIGKRVREIREDRGMPMAELARRTGLHRNTILRLENGRHVPGVDNIEKIAHALRVPTVTLFEEPPASEVVPALPKVSAPLRRRPGHSGRGPDWVIPGDVVAHGAAPEEEEAEMAAYVESLWERVEAGAITTDEAQVLLVSRYPESPDLFGGGPVVSS